MADRHADLIAWLRAKGPGADKSQAAADALEAEAARVDELERALRRAMPLIEDNAGVGEGFVKQYPADALALYKQCRAALKDTTP